MDELYLDNIDEFVNDHNKIVTYKWLSLTLGVHVNTAKQMLYHYLEDKRKESSPQLHATYLVSGKFVDNGQTCHKVSVVREEQLEDFKSKMSLIVSVHVYSVQKASLKDSGPLYSVDYDAVKDNVKSCSKYSAIRCASAVPMSSVEHQQVREIERAPSSVPENKKSGINGETSGPCKPSAKPQKGIMGMFSHKSAPKNQENSKETKSGQKEDSPVLEAPKTKQPAKAKPMANFFGSQTKKPVKEQREAQPSVTAEQQHQSSQPEEKHEPAAAQQQKDSKTESRSKTKRIEDSDSEEETMEKKKRRRIKRPEPDSSDEDVIPDSPQAQETSEQSPEEVAETVQHLHGNSETKIRKRRRVLKSQIFTDDDGCMVTEKGYVSESYSETEDDVQTNKQAPRDIKAKLPTKETVKKSQKKSSAITQKGSKQASIMGFFQKK